MVTDSTCIFQMLLNSKHAFLCKIHTKALIKRVNSFWLHKDKWIKSFIKEKFHNFICIRWVGIILFDHTILFLLEISKKFPLTMEGKKVFPSNIEFHPWYKASQTKDQQKVGRQKQVIVSDLAKKRQKKLLWTYMFIF